jgi:SAM-dependent methyltransferase
MSDDREKWGQPAWTEAHFPVGQLDTLGDTWGFRWRGMEKWRHGRTLDLLKPLLRGTGRQEVLEIGCALCDFTVRAWRLNPENHFCGVDPVAAAIDWAGKRFPQFELRIGSAPGIPFSRKFDLILCMQVLCYLPPAGRRESIHNIWNSLKPGGTMVFSGVLDGGVRYHTTEEVLGMIGEKLEIRRVAYSHWSLYQWLVGNPLDSAHLRLGRIRDQLKASPDEFSRWRASADPRVAAAVATLRWLGPFSKLPVAGTMVVTDFVRRRATLAMLAHQLSRIVRRNNAADEIVVIASKARVPTGPA